MSANTDPARGFVTLTKVDQLIHRSASQRPVRNHRGDMPRDRREASVCRPVAEWGDHWDLAVLGTASEVRTPTFPVRDRRAAVVDRELERRATDSDPQRPAATWPHR